MYKKICVPYDRSEQSQRAAATAQRWAEVFGADITGIVADRHAEKIARAQRMAELLPERFRPDPPKKNGHAAAVPPFAAKTLDGPASSAYAAEIDAGEYDLAVVRALGEGEEGRGVGPICERLVRSLRTDVLVVKGQDEVVGPDSDTILVCVDGSKESYAGLQRALALGKEFGKKVEAVGVYDPYLHYTLFNGIVSVLSEKASAIFKFADQEKLHEEIIDTGLAKIYQAHLEVAARVARDDGHDIRITLLDGKAFQKLLRHAQRTKPWMMVVGRIGVHSDDGMDVGATTENLLRTAPCDLLITSDSFVPPVDVQADAAIQWVEEARRKMDRVPDFVKGVATTAILRWAMERGHSVITPSVINSAMGDLLPAGAAQAMGYVAEEMAIKNDRLNEGTTFICRECGHSVRDIRPALCVVCKADANMFEEIDREKIEALGKLEKGNLEEETTFDGKKLTWSQGAKEVIRRVPSGYQRRRSKARIEKTARVRGIATVTQAFAIDMVEQDLAETSYLSGRGENLKIEVKADERPDDDLMLARENSPLPWTNAAWKRMCRVPDGFMRKMTRERVEQFASEAGADGINLDLCEKGLAEGRKMMAQMLGNYETPEGKAAIRGKAADAAPPKN